MSLLAKIRETARMHGPTAGSIQKTIPAPVKGWNTRDALATMKPEYAVALDNYFPDHGAVRLRKGSKEYAANVGTDSVETLIPHYSGATAKFFAAGSGALYDISTAGDPGAALRTGFTADRWDHAAAGGHTILMNGTDEPVRIEPGGTLAAAHGWTGPADASRLYRVMTFKRRIFAIEKNTAKVWYGPLDGIQGAMSALDLSFISPEGGNCTHLGTMTLDAGSGVDDLFIAFFDHGSALVYQGVDPAAGDDTGFFLVGRFETGKLVGDRPLVNMGGDLLAHTADGIVSLSALFQHGRSGDGRGSISSRIAPSIREQAEAYGATTGWDSILHPQASWLMFNAPASSGEQFVMNVRTGAWCRFHGWPARCLGRFQERLFFGRPDGAVHEAHVGMTDDGNPIAGSVQTAFNQLGTERRKRVILMRPIVGASAPISFRTSIATDFGRLATAAAPSRIGAEGAEWNAAAWETAAWGSNFTLHDRWIPADRHGSTISLRVASSTANADVAFYAANVRIEVQQDIL